MAAELTASSRDDASTLPNLLNPLEVPIRRFTADGAYDHRSVYNQVSAAGTENVVIVIPPRRSAVSAGPRDGPWAQREAALQRIRKVGRREWQKESGYGMDLTRRPSGKWIVDFGDTMSKAQAALYEAPFGYINEHVKPVRQGNREKASREFWFRHWNPRPGMWRALDGLPRYIATPRVAKHRLFIWCETSICPDCQLIVIARDDDTTFGILHSRFHEAWALRLGTSLEDRPRYTPTTTFETFPFPEGLSPDIPAANYVNDPRAAAIAAAVQRLVELRNRWRNPPEWVEWVDEPVPGCPKRPVPRDETSAKELKKRTLTNLYNARPQWLADAHASLDAAVATAYGWSADISDDDALRELLALNLANRC